jgi:AcrR family transcriptional regulator
MVDRTERDGERTPEPPWRVPAGLRPARKPLTREAIVDAALRILERDGLDAVSMRRVGDELGTGAASLYWHVRNKDELLQLVFEHVTDGVALPEPDPEHWREQLRTFAEQTRATLNRHGGVARLSLGRIPAGPTLARLTEWLFELLRPVGVPDQVIAYFGDLAGLYVGAYAFEESLGLASPTGEELPPEEIVGMLRDYITSLPEDRFPATRGSVDLLFGGDVEERFRFGIELMIRGLETYADASVIRRRDPVDEMKES